MEITKRDRHIDRERTTEHHCERHGTDAAKKLRMLRKDTDLLIELNDEQFQKLLRACSGHTVGLHDSDMTIGACWDSDRLDLNRVDIYPDANYIGMKNKAELMLKKAQSDKIKSSLSKLIELINSKKKGI